MTKMLHAALIAASFAAFAAPAAAVELPVETAHAGYRETGASKDWVSIYTPSRGEDAMRVCALYSRPIETAVYEDGETVSAMRGELAAFINWNEDTPSSDTGEVSFILGAPVEPGDHDTHELVVDDESAFQLVGDGDRLYVMPEDDDQVLEAIRKGSRMTVTAALADGDVAVDEYSLMGVMATTGIAKESCK